MRRWAPALLVTAALAGCGGQRGAADACAGAGFSGGSSAADGIFFAVVPAGCATARRRTCAVGDGTSAIARVVVPPGIAQSCVAFNQFVGAGLNQVPGFLAGECFGRARVAAPPDLPARERVAPRACRRRGERSAAVGPEPAPVERARGGTAVVEGRAADPHGTAPEAGAVGRRRTGRAPPWAVLAWRSRGGRRCYAAGQVVDGGTPGRADQLPGVRPEGPGLTETLVGSLRHDSRSGTGIQLYGLGRFTPFPIEEGGACGDPSAGPGLLVSWERRYARPDHTLGHLLVAGIAGPRIRAIAVGGRRVAIGRRARTFLRALPGDARPPEVEVGYSDGGRRRFGAGAIL